MSGFRHKTIPPGTDMTLKQLREGGYVLNEKQWLQVRMMYQTLDTNTHLHPAYPIPRIHCGRSWHGSRHASPSTKLASYAAR